MVSTYSPSLRLELMATGDQSGTWGDTTNTNLGELLEQAITGVLSKAMADTDQTLTNSNGAVDEARNMVVTVTGALTAARNVIVPDASKLYLFRNVTTGGFDVTIKTAAGTGVAVPMGAARWVYSNGINVIDGEGTLGIGFGGTGAFTAAGARTALEVPGLNITNTWPAPQSFANNTSVRSGNVGAGTAIFPFNDSAGTRLGYVGVASIGNAEVVLAADSSSMRFDSFGSIVFQPSNGGTTLTLSNTAATSTVPVRVPDGTVSVPSIAPASDTDTGVNFPTNAIAFGVGGVETARINATEFLLGQTAGWNPSTDALRGINITKNGQFIASNVSLPSGSFVRMTSNGRALNTYRDTTNVGGATVTTTATSWDTSSDERLKDFIGNYDPMKAIDIIRRDPVRDFHWNHYMGDGEGVYAVGWGAQTSYAVSEDLATPGEGEPGEPDFQPWGVDQGKRTPYLWAALTWALDKIDELTARIEALEA